MVDTSFDYQLFPFRSFSFTTALRPLISVRTVVEEVNRQCEGFFIGVVIVFVICAAADP